jgi:hypothetical protein
LKSENHGRKRREISSSSPSTTTVATSSGNGTIVVSFNITTDNQISLVSLPDASKLSNVAQIVRTLFQLYSILCWRRSYGRGAGHGLDTCPSDASDRDGLLCYPPCQSGYNADGPVCWQQCDSGMKGVLTDCIGSVDGKNCPWYNKCGSCATCPENYNKFVCTCTRHRDSYGRGGGKAMICPANSEQNGLLCYPRCDSKYTGDGPVCWSLCPTATQPVVCGAGCAKTKLDCAIAVGTMVESVVVASFKIISFVIDAPFTSVITDILTSVKLKDWTGVAKLIGNSAFKFAKLVMPDIAKKFSGLNETTLQSAIHNASLIMILTSISDNLLLQPLLTYFNIDGVINAYDHGSCSFVDGSN